MGNKRKTCVVVGGCGHVGLPFAVAATKGNDEVIIHDISEKNVKLVRDGKLPFLEHGLEEPLQKALKDKKLIVTTNYGYYIRSYDVSTWVITMGTPVDEEGNARVDDILNFVKGLCEVIKQNIKYYCGNIDPNYDRMIILRSTVAPGTTEVVNQTFINEGVAANVVFAPERVLQTKGYEEVTKLPQLIGAFDSKTLNQANEFFQRMGVEKVLLLDSPREVEVAKLITNMARYVEFALANEFYMLADRLSDGGKDGVQINMHEVINVAKHDYPRLLGLPLPGPNVGGPCLFKDGKFLLKNSPWTSLLSCAFNINEGMPQFLFDKAQRIWTNLGHGKIKKIGIFGMTFKANCDDTRNSLSFKLKKIAKQNGVECLHYDPYIDRSTHNFKGCDVIFVMTPHDAIKERWKKFVIDDTTLMVDAWKSIDEWSSDGFFIKGYPTEELPR